MTRPDSVESTLKGQLSVEDAKMEMVVRDLLNDNVAVLRNDQLDTEQEPKLQIARVAKRTHPRRNKLGRITRRLYNLESENEPEKQLNIELNLYQMETY